MEKEKISGGILEKQTPGKVIDCFLENVRISHCDFINTAIERTTFKGCQFENVNFSGSKLEGVRMEDCVFRKSKFVGAFMRPSSEKKDDGVIRTTTFTECDLSKFGIGPVIIDKCLFDKCRFLETQSSARYSDVRFIGKIKDTWFRGFPLQGKKLSWLDKLFAPKRDPKKRNRMINVDMSKAQLDGVFFTDGIDLSTCTFPEQDGYFRVDNFSQVFKKVRETISTDWQSPYKENALSAIDRLYFDDHKTDMDIDFIYTGFEFSTFPTDFKSRFFGLIKETNKAMLGS